MDFSTLRALKGMVTKRNERAFGAPVEFWFPMMFADGKWSATLVFGSILQPEDVRIFIPFLEGVGASYFISTCNEDMAIYVQ